MLAVNQLLLKAVIGRRELNDKFVALLAVPLTNLYPAAF